jgi:hypothetical protein
MLNATAMSEIGLGTILTTVLTVYAIGSGENRPSG